MVKYNDIINAIGLIRAGKHVKVFEAAVSIMLQCKVLL